MKKENSLPDLILRQMSIVFIIIVLTLSSCQESDEIINQPDEHFVDIGLAQDLVNNLQIPIQQIENGARTTLIQTKKIGKIDPIPDDEGNTMYYIINYESGGFLILSADNRTHPVLAYSGESTFPMDLAEYPDGLVGWLTEEGENIKEIRKSKRKQLKELAKLWKKVYIQEFLKGGLDGIIYPDDPPTDPSDPDCVTQEIRGPLLATTWNQGCGYNDLAPTCASGGSCGRVWTGCVATAMAQIMRFHQFPTNYNWASMPNNTGSPETSRLMRDIGDAVDMSWGCESSGADTDKDVVPAFKNDFGYSSASYADYSSSQRVTTNIRNNRPVIFKGGTKKTFLGIPYYGGGHAWVCDGFRSTYFCNTGNTYLYYHMNWGWGNSPLNGWYGNTDWRPGGRDYTYKKGVVYNIIP